MSISVGGAWSARFGPFEVDFRAGELFKQGRRIRLQDQPLQILAMLLEHPGEVMSREELRQKLWPSDTFVDFDQGLNNAVNRLREALSDSADNPRYIETLPRRGYRFIAPVEGTAHESRTEFLIGRRLAHYRVIEEIGAGGMGVVYRARDEGLDREVALKVLPAAGLADENARNQFHTEALALAKLNHPNIEALYAMETENGVDFLVMELVPGVTLREKLSAGALPEREVARLGLQLASALEEAHERGVVHRDLKPGNIIVTPKRQAKVLDFGLARLLRPPTDVNPGGSPANRPNPKAEVAGTLCYMAPEQLRGELGDARADLYALGAVLYEMATGHRVFQEELEPQLIEAILHTSPTPPRSLNGRISFDLDRIILKCLDKKPEKRYQSAKELSLDLRRLAGPASFLTSRIRWDVQPLRRRSVPQGLAAAAILAFVLLLVAVKVTPWRERLIGATRPGPIQSVVVLPFENLSSDPSQEYFADGITDALTTELAQIGSLRVISRTTAIQYKGTKKTLREIGRELNVDAVVEGSVQRSGDRLSISAQLVEPKTDRHLWARPYETALGDILSLESRVANDVTREMQLRLTPQERSRLSRTRVALPEAYENYLRAKPHLWLGSREDDEAAIELLERAVAIDPNFAQAYAALAMVYNARWVALVPQQEQWEEKAFGAVEKALALDPDLADGYLARGRMLWNHRNHYPHERAIFEYRRALALDPNLAEAHHELASIYNHIGVLEKGRQEIEKAVALDPLNTGARFRVGINLLYQAKYEEALSAIRDSERYFPRLWAFQTAFALFQLGRKEEASARIEEYLQKHPKEPDTGGLLASMQALFAAAERRNSRAEEKIQRAIRIGQGYQHFHHAAYAIASAYSLMNKPEAAMTWLERAAAEGFPCYPLFEKDPNLNNLRQDPRFIEFMTRQKKQWEYFKATL